MSRTHSDQPQWRRMRFKHNKVWKATDHDGRPIQQNGKLLIKYQLEQDYEYWVNPANVGPLDALQTETGRSPKSATPVKTEKPMPPPARTQCTYTPTAPRREIPVRPASGLSWNTGKRRKKSRNSSAMQPTTWPNSKRSAPRLLELKRRNLPVRIYTDSSYAQGVLSLGWKAHKNKELVKAIRELLSALKDVTLLKVRGHAGHEQNERADQLARAAIVSGGRRCPS